VSVFTSIVLLNGLRDVLQRRKLAWWLTLCGLTAPELLAAYAKLVVVVWPVPLPAPISVDPVDAVLVCAVVAHAQAIVSGDRHLLDLKIDHGISSLTAPELLARITPTATSSS
jgi:predicted nucleic acid-binding protein